MTEWKDQPATKGDVYRVLKKIEELSILVESQQAAVVAQRQERDKTLARIPRHTADQCENCHGSGFAMIDLTHAAPCPSCSRKAG